MLIERHLDDLGDRAFRHLVPVQHERRIRSPGDDPTARK
jgi:hypothetical protein